MTEIKVNDNNRTQIIDQLNRSFLAMDYWVKCTVKHAMGAPSHHPETGKKFETFLEVIEAASDETLETLLAEFADNGDLIE